MDRRRERASACQPARPELVFARILGVPVRVMFSDDMPPRLREDSSQPEQRARHRARHRGFSTNSQRRLEVSFYRYNYRNYRVP